MVKSKRRRHSSEFKFKVAVEGPEGGLDDGGVIVAVRVAVDAASTVEEDASGRRGTGV